MRGMSLYLGETRHRSKVTKAHRTAFGQERPPRSLVMNDTLIEGCLWNFLEGGAQRSLWSFGELLNLGLVISQCRSGRYASALVISQSRSGRYA